MSAFTCDFNRSILALERPLLGAYQPFGSGKCWPNAVVATSDFRSLAVGANDGMKLTIAGKQNASGNTKTMIRGLVT